MFTGIVEECGTVAGIRTGAHGAQVTISARTVLEGTQVGDSIAVNGICLTVTSLSPTAFTADVMNETLNRSQLGTLRACSPVNLERAMQLGGRLGGHLVSGHIDATGTIRRVSEDGNAVWYTVEAPETVLRYVVEKGSITIDGISLTVASVGQDSFQVSVIPHTRAVTNLASKSVGSLVNLEADLVGKYVEKLLFGHAGASDAQAEPAAAKGITMEFLAQNGF